LYNQNVLLVQKNQFKHWNDNDENHYVYLAGIGRHSEKSRRKRHHACAAKNYII